MGEFPDPFLQDLVRFVAHWLSPHHVFRDQLKAMGISELSYKTQRLPGFRTAVYEVARNPQAILVRIKSDFVEETAERIVAALQVAYCVLGQLVSCQCKTPGTASVKGGIGASKFVPLSASMR